MNPAEQRKAYDEALELLKEGRYNDASAAFQSFLKTYPGSSYADNAQYWLGEVYYVTRKFKPALAEFGKVLTNIRDSTKIADAKLKMGYIHYEKKTGQKRENSGAGCKGFSGQYQCASGAGAHRPHEEGRALDGELEAPATYPALPASVSWSACLFGIVDHFWRSPSAVSDR